MPEEKVKTSLALPDTAGIVSVLQLVDTTQSENFATLSITTSEIEVQRIIYSPIISEQEKESTK